MLNFDDFNSFFYQNYSHFDQIIKTQLSVCSETISFYIEKIINDKVKDLLDSQVDNFLKEKINYDDINKSINFEKNKSIKQITNIVDENKTKLINLFRKTEQDYLKIKKSLNNKNTINNMVDQYSNFFGNDSDYVELEKIGKCYTSIKEDLKKMKNKNKNNDKLKDDKIEKLLLENISLKDEINSLKAEFNKFIENDNNTNKINNLVDINKTNIIENNITKYVNEMEIKFNKKYVLIDNYNLYKKQQNDKINQINSLINNIQIKNDKKQIDLLNFKVSIKRINEFLDINYNYTQNLGYHLTNTPNNDINDLIQNIKKIKSIYNIFSKKYHNHQQESNYKKYKYNNKVNEIQGNCKQRKKENEYNLFKVVHWDPARNGYLDF